MQNHHRRIVGLAIALGCNIFVPFASAQTIQDGDFIDTSWSHDLYVNHPRGDAVVTVERNESEGNPGAAQTGSHTLNNGRLRFAHLNLSATYDPGSSGPLECVTFSIDFRVIGGTGECGPNPSDPQAAVGVILRQGNDYFVCPAIIISPAQSQGWITIVANALISADFAYVQSDGSVDESIHPDFSVGGALLEFGYETGNKTDLDSCSREWVVDNFSLNFNDVEHCVIQVENSTWGGLKDLYHP